MSALWTSAEIEAATGGTASAPFEVDGVTFDSREVGPGDLFVAMPGTVADGHEFVAAAFGAGAAGALVSQPTEGPHILVPDVAAALTALAIEARRRVDATIIGVTGSVGKTSTKEALADALERSCRCQVHRSVKSYNNHTGVPLSLARMPRDTLAAVFEMGMNHAGEIAGLTQLVRPNIAVITTIAPAHIENFADESGIADAKAEIFGGLAPGGTAILPCDSPHFARLRAHADRFAGRIIGFGLTEGADVTAERVVLHPDCSCVTARIGDHRLTFKVGMAGRHWVGNALAVLAAVDAAGGDLALAGLALAELTDLPGRGRRLRVAVGQGSAIVIDESYNANPASMAASLAVLAEVTPRGNGRRLAMLGAMRELGDRSDAFHADLAPHVVAAGVTSMIVVGNEMKALATALGRQLDVIHVADAAAAGAAVGRLLAADDVLLVKGSNSVGLGDVVKALESREGAG